MFATDLSLVSWGGRLPEFASEACGQTESCGQASLHSTVHKYTNMLCAHMLCSCMLQGKSFFLRTEQRQLEVIALQKVCKSAIREPGVKCVAELVEGVLVSAPVRLTE